MDEDWIDFPLHEAAQAADLTKVEEILARGVGINPFDDSSHTALH